MPLLLVPVVYLFSPTLQLPASAALQDFISRHFQMEAPLFSCPLLLSLFSLLSTVPLLSFPSLLSALAPPPPLLPPLSHFLSASPPASRSPLFNTLSLHPLLFLASIPSSFTHSASTQSCVRLSIFRYFMSVWWVCVRAEWPPGSQANTSSHPQCSASIPLAE